MKKPFLDKFLSSLNTIALIVSLASVVFYVSKEVDDYEDRMGSVEKSIKTLKSRVRFIYAKIEYDNVMRNDKQVG